ncbi:MAG: hypothetical protein PHT46_04595 [Candidatus Marinimicrobia bacterium]|nr:hypothetical protein [Candidatus Neomarinimicrobiota bacterium]
MNKRPLILVLALMILVCGAFAFEQAAVWAADYRNPDTELPDMYALTGNPAGKLYAGNIQYYRIKGTFSDAAYRRIYDPARTQLYNADYTALMQINHVSYFSASIIYEDLRLREIFGSMDKDFYDDYFSMVDSTSGNVAFYGPQLKLLYNVKLSEKLFFGLEGNYGVERSLKDTFPQTATIMRNSGYRAGLEYRGKAASLGIFGRYYDNQVHYEAVKQYMEVKPRTYMGYNIFYNELASATANKVRTRNGLEYGTHFSLGRQSRISAQFGISGLHRISRADVIRGSYTRERGLWQREGLHLFGILNIFHQAEQGLRLYADHLHYSDWGASRISNTLVIENAERFSTLGAVFYYRPSLAQQIYAGAEARRVSYDYREYIFPFHDTRGGWEWNISAGGRIYLSAKTRMGFDLKYGKEIPRFYWETPSFENLGAIISLEKLFSFGYITFDVEYLQKTPENKPEKINVFLIGLSYGRK